MAKARRTNKTPKRIAIPTRVAHVQAPEDPQVRALRIASAEPSPILVVGIIGFLIAVSIFGSRYVMNPNLLTGPWLYIVGALAALFTFLTMSTLTSMAYCFLFHRNTTVVRAFAAALGNYTAIGAILGTLLGLRLVIPFGNELSQNRDDHDQPFMEYISLVGSAATIVTLMMIGLCWARSLGVVIFTIRNNVGVADTPSRKVALVHKILPGLIVLSVNAAAVEAAQAMFVIVTSK